MKGNIRGRLDQLEKVTRYRQPGEWDAEWESAFSSMTDEELDAVISGCEKTDDHEELLDNPAWRAANLTTFESTAIEKFKTLDTRHMETQYAKTN